MARVRRKSSDALDFHGGSSSYLSWPDVCPLPDDKEASAAILNIFERVLQGRSRDDWSAHELVLAAKLAGATKLMTDLENQLHNEGCFITREGRTGPIEVTSPVVDAYGRMAGIVGSLTTKLSAAAGAKGVNAGSMRNHAKATGGAKLAKSAEGIKEWGSDA